jgi:Ca2+-binding RTX toxin-like protein
MSAKSPAESQDGTITSSFFGPPFTGIAQGDSPLMPIQCYDLPPPLPFWIASPDVDSAEFPAPFGSIPNWIGSGALAVVKSDTPAVIGSSASAHLPPSFSQSELKLAGIGGRPASPGPTPPLNISWAGEAHSSGGNADPGPPDDAMAAGTTAVITAVNFHVDIYDKSGHDLSSQTLNDFFGASPTNFVYDPRVIWDQFAGRFIVTAGDNSPSDSSNSEIHVAVSKDANPLDGWYQYTFNVASGSNWLDYPIVGLDSSTLYFGGNYYSPGGTPVYQSSSVWAVNKSLLEAGQAVTAWNYGVTSIGAPGNQLYTPAHMYWTEAGLNGDFQVSYLQGATDALKIIRLQNASSGSATWNFQSINVGALGDVAVTGARQKGTPDLIDDGDDRVQSAVWRNNRLYAVTDLRVNTFGGYHDVVHWFVIDTSNLAHLTLVSQGNIDYGSNNDTYYGSMAVDRNGNMLIGYSFSGPSAYASSVYAEIPAGGTTLQNSLYLTTGQGADTNLDTDGRVRWGDYSSVSIDPSDNRSFWVFNQYATNSNEWATTVGGVFIRLLIVGTGHHQRLVGGPGNDTIDGGPGNNTLAAGAGSAHDAFKFDRAIGPGHIDWITNFRHGVDTIQLSHLVFAGLHHVGLPAFLTAPQFDHGAVAHRGSDRILYDQAHGTLYYDRDGTGPALPVKFAILVGDPAVGAHDFLIV